MDYEKLSDDDLVSVSAAGDGRAFEMLVRRYSSLVMGLAIARTGERDKAKDVVQETFLRVFRKLSAYNRKAKFSTWLYKVASNLIKDNHKYARRHPAGPLMTEQVARDFRLGRRPGKPDEALRLDELRSTVLVALGELRGQLREVLILRDVQGRSYEEIAEIIRCSLGTVKSRVSRARLKFKDVYVRLTRR